MKRYLIGVDEVGRGPLAGPVAVGVCATTKSVPVKFRGIKESKQLSRKQREKWYEKLSLARGRDFDFAVSFVSPRTVDRIGITASIKKATTRALKKLDRDPKKCRVLLDGGLHAPEAYTDQRTIIRGDAKEAVIAIASVVAKVERDRAMYKLHTRYPRYGFDRHVGYGTDRHILAIKKYGPSAAHRKSFLRNII